MPCHALFHALEANADAEKAVQMAAYMRNQFEFLGVQSKMRREAAKDILKTLRNESEINWHFIACAWENPYREMQYCAGDYLGAVKKRLTPADVPTLQQFAQQKSWWDTIDSLDTIIGDIALQHPEVNATLLAWSTHEDVWLRRIAIDHQRFRKTETDTDLLEAILVNNLDHTEFFINKAIGWSLRSYSKTDPDWVRAFITCHGDRMAALSIREASKYL